MVLGWTLGAQDCLMDIVLLYHLHFHLRIAWLKPFILLGLKTKKLLKIGLVYFYFFLHPTKNGWGWSQTKCELSKIRWDPIHNECEWNKLNKITIKMNEDEENLDGLGIHN
jgi:hypothetical protein